jgi:hypothetical protein
LLETGRIFQFTELRQAVPPRRTSPLRFGAIYPVGEGEPLPGKHRHGRGEQCPAIHLALQGGHGWAGDIQCQCYVVFNFNDSAEVRAGKKKSPETSA